MFPGILLAGHYEDAKRARDHGAKREYLKAAEAMEAAAKDEILTREEALAYRLGAAGYYANTKDLDKALSIIDEILEQIKGDPVLETDMIHINTLIARISNLSLAKRFDEAQKQLDELYAMDFERFYDWGRSRSRFLFTCGTFYAGQQQYEKALLFLLESFAEYPEFGNSSMATYIGVYMHNAEAAGQSVTSNQKIRELLTRAILRNADKELTCERLLEARAKMFMSEGDFDRAAYDAKILISVSTSSQSLESGISMLSMMLKAKDGNLARVNRFLEYQKYGKVGADGELGTDDDLSNPIESLTAPADDAMEALYQEELDRTSKDWVGAMKRAGIYRLRGKPDKALAELRVAYRICPYDQRALQRVSDQLIQVLVQVTGDPKAGERFIAFQKYGVAGVDGKTGTQDDLKDILAAAGN